MAREGGANPFGLDGLRVLVTGAGGGIGRALVAAFRRAGAEVIGADRDPAALDGLDLAGRIVFDLVDGAAVEQVLGEHIARHGAPDILVNNAGWTRAELLRDVDRAKWDHEVDLNLNGVYAVTRAVVDGMAARGGGSIVFISSVNALAHFGNPAYSAAKAGLVALARAVAVEEGERGIRANVICPGSVRTHAWDHRAEREPGIEQKVARHYPLGRMVRPEEVANAAVFLASPAASGISGAVLPVDAGLTAGNLRFVRDIIEGRD